MMKSIPNRYLTPLFDVAAIRRREQASFAAEGESFAMMQRAGSVLYQHILRHFPVIRHLAVVAGGGGNGGDGYVVAALAAQDGITVTVYDLAEVPKQGDALRAEQAALNDERVVVFKGVEALHNTHYAVIVDAVTGIGFKPPLSSSYVHAVQKINKCRADGAWVISVDSPSGLDVSNGLGDPVVQSDLVVSFIAGKIGHYLLDGCVACDAVVIENLQAVDLPDCAPACFLNPTALEIHPPCQRSRHSHKGTYGHVTVIGGDIGFGGAAILASEAAAKSGAGTVSLYSHKRHLNASLVRNPNVMCVTDKDVQLEQVLKNDHSVIVVGPGLGRSEWSSAVWDQFTAQKRAAVIDADGLYWLAEKPVELQSMVLTPHPGEAARLLGCDLEEILADVVLAAKSIAKRYQAVVILKGTTSVVASPQREIIIVGKPCPGLAKGGSGDVLSGMVGACLAYYRDAFEAAVIAAAWHNKSAIVCQQQVGAVGMQPYQLLDYLE